MKNKILAFLLVVNVLFPTFVFAESELMNINKPDGKFGSTMEKFKPYINPGETIYVNDGRNGVIYSSGFKFDVGAVGNKDLKPSSPEKTKIKINLKSTK